MTDVAIMIISCSFAFVFLCAGIFILTYAHSATVGTIAKRRQYKMLQQTAESELLRDDRRKAGTIIGG